MEQAQTQTTSVDITVTNSWTRLGATAVAHMTEHLYVGVITVALPVIASAMGLSMAQIGSLVSTRSLVAGIVNLPSGFLADAIRRRTVLLGVCLVFLGLASLLMSFAQSFWSLMVFMAIGGLGSGSFHPQSIAILSTAYRERRAFALGIHDSAANLGEVIAPLTIGALLAYTDWRTTLQIWALPGLIVGISYAMFFPEANRRGHRGARWQRLLPKELLKNRDILVMFLVSVFRTLGQSALTVALPLYLTLHLKLSVAVMGLYISTLFFFAGISPSISGWVADRIGRMSLIIIGSALAALSVVALPHLPAGIPLGIGCLRRRLALGLTAHDLCRRDGNGSAGVIRHHGRVALQRQYGAFVFGTAHSGLSRRCLWFTHDPDLYWYFSAPGLRHAVIFSTSKTSMITMRILAFMANRKEIISRFDVLQKPIAGYFVT